jgi:hypothetical protein
MNLYEPQLHKPPLMARRTITGQHIAVTEIKYATTRSVLTPQRLREQFRLDTSWIKENEPVSVPQHVITQRRSEILLPRASLLRNSAKKDWGVQIRALIAPNAHNPCDGSYPLEIESAIWQVIEKDLLFPTVHYPRHACLQLRPASPARPLCSERIELNRNRLIHIPEASHWSRY